MDCRELNSQIDDYCDDSVSPQTYLKISKHLKECPACQQLYQLTRLENEVLRDTSDIPALSPDFTARVMDSIGSVHRKPGIFYNRRFWYSGMAAAAVLVLILFVPQLLKNPASVNMADNARYGNDSVAPPAVSTPANGDTTEMLAENQDNQQDIAASPRPGDEAEAPGTPSLFDAPAETPSLPSVLGTKQTTDTNTISGEGIPSQKSVASQSQPVEIFMLRAPDTPISAPVAARNGSAAVVEDIEPVLTPVNVPPNLQLLQVDISTSNRTVYDYASQDGLAKVQITVDPYIEPEVQLRILEKADTEGINNLSRWVKLNGEMVTVTYSGNVSVEELTNLANTVRFQ